MIYTVKSFSIVDEATMLIVAVNKNELAPHVFTWIKLTYAKHKKQVAKHIYSETLIKHLRHAIKMCVYLFIYRLSVQIVKANKWALLSGR